MDWYLPADMGAVSDLRREVRAYIERHCTPESDVDAAELAFSELLTNAVEHAGNSSVWVSLDWMSVRPVVTIHDLGPRFELSIQPVSAESMGGRGLMIASHLTRELKVASRAIGNRVSAALEVERPPTRDIEVEVEMGSTGLPALIEAVDGYFPREAFMRALVVELAATVERTQGPGAAEVAITAVGSKIGRQMERAYRSENELTEALRPDDVAALSVGLKAAIGGGFYLVSIDVDKIVLGNRRCPFGEHVREEPSLCRMTSSVFGGIAARSTGGEVAVHLEERIAVGDPECRVVIWLREPPPEIVPHVHRYRPVNDRAS